MLITVFLATVGAFFRSRVDTALEILALRQQVAVLKRKRPRPSMNRLHRFFWTTLRHTWPRWSDVLVIMKPETVVGRHRARFRLYWRWRARPRHILQKDLPCECRGGRGFFVSPYPAVIAS